MIWTGADGSGFDVGGESLEVLGLESLTIN